jgi:nitroreductase
MPKNQEWAKTAWVLGISAAKKTFTHNSGPNRFGMHDAGAGLANLMIEAMAEGLYTHGMGGFDADAARKAFGVPEDFEMGAAFAIGYLGDGQQPGVRSRRALADQAFTTTWGEAYLK